MMGKHRTTILTVGLGLALASTLALALSLVSTLSSVSTLAIELATIGDNSKPSVLTIQSHQSWQSTQDNLIQNFVRNIRVASAGDIDVKVVYSPTVVNSIDKFGDAESSVFDCVMASDSYQDVSALTPIASQLEENSISNPQFMISEQLVCRPDSWAAIPERHRRIVEISYKALMSDYLMMIQGKRNTKSKIDPENGGKPDGSHFDELVKYQAVVAGL